MTSPQPPASGTQHCFLALDLGTTTLVGRLLGADGTVLAETRAVNPQRSRGADILARLQHAHEQGGEELQSLLVDGLRRLIADLLQQAGCPASAISAAAAAGNPGISHLLCALPVADLLHPPHRSPLKQLSLLPPDAPDLGLSVPLQLFPAVTGFVGGDLLADLFGITYGTGLGVAQLNRACGAVEALNRLPTTAEGADTTIQHFNDSTKQDDLPVILLLDLGTNAELALWDGVRWRVTSAAAGPAFEAGNIACGMSLAPGAVTDVQVHGDRLVLEVVGGGRPAGLCGSGLLALVAAARQGGLIDAGGRIVAPDEVGTNLARYLAADGEGWAICFHRDARGALCLTQDDVRQLQLAKGAVRAGVEVLLDRAGLTAATVAAVGITGAFGAALPTAALKGIALLPAAMLEKLFFVPDGVVAGLGAFLGDPQGTVHLAALQQRCQPSPLSGTPAFEKRFMKALEF